LKAVAARQFRFDAAMRFSLRQIFLQWQRASMFAGFAFMIDADVDGFEVGSVPRLEDNFFQTSSY